MKMSVEGLTYNDKTKQKKTKPVQNQKQNTDIKNTENMQIIKSFKNLYLHSCSSLC